MSYQDRKSEPAFTLKPVTKQVFQPTFDVDQILADVVEFRPSLAGEFEVSEGFEQWLSQVVAPFARLKYGKMIEFLAEALEEMVERRDNLDEQCAAFDRKGHEYRREIAKAMEEDEESIEAIRKAREESRQRARAEVKAKKAAKKAAKASKPAGANSN